MNFNEIKYNYKKYYENIQFERIGLFNCIKNNFKIDNVIYLGSSIHITPSFIFPNVTYVDTSELSSLFFQDIKSVAT